MYFNPIQYKKKYEFYYEKNVKAGPKHGPNKHDR